MYACFRISLKRAYVMMIVAHDIHDNKEEDPMIHCDLVIPSSLMGIVQPIFCVSSTITDPTNSQIGAYISLQHHTMVRRQGVQDDIQCPITSHHITPHHITSHHITPHHFIFYFRHSSPSQHTSYLPTYIRYYSLTHLLMK